MCECSYFIIGNHNRNYEISLYIISFKFDTDDRREIVALGGATASYTKALRCLANKHRHQFLKLLF